MLGRRRKEGREGEGREIREVGGEIGEILPCSDEPCVLLLLVIQNDAARTG